LIVVVLVVSLLMLEPPSGVLVRTCEPLCWSPLGAVDDEFDVDSDPAGPLLKVLLESLAAPLLSLLCWFS
jgi:hypothetical protein